jgi:hypothetical protein
MVLELSRGQVQLMNRSNTSSNEYGNRINQHLFLSRRRKRQPVKAVAPTSSITALLGSGTNTRTISLLIRARLLPGYASSPTPIVKFSTGVQNK